MSSIVHELTLLQEREGWLSEPALRQLAQRMGVPLHRLESVSSFYTHFRRRPPKGRRIDVCRDLPCHLAGAESAIVALRRAAARDGADVEISEVSCLGRCDRAPAACVGRRILDASATDSLLAVDDAAAPAEPETPNDRWQADPYSRPGDHYTTLRDALDRDPSELISILDRAGLRGMGGAGFPTGKKWSLVARETREPKYVICNADESEPGTFKDRQILLDLPHLVIEGMLLAAYCIGSERGHIFIRREYEPERRRIEAAIARARASGVLGNDIFGSGFRFEIEVFVSPGGYILGEETALLECMEDRRGEPRNKPPFPGNQGLWGQPTLINNVETFVHCVGILRDGPDWWNALGRPGYSGHKFMSVSGDVAEPGVELVPMGSTLGELLAARGGLRGQQPLLAVAPGGASSNFLPASKLDVPIDFASIEAAGSMLGSGAAVYIDEDRDLLQLGLNIARFFRNESCGKCVPCRMGCEKGVELVETSDPRSADTRALLEQLHGTLRRTSLCGLGQVALGPLISILDHFPDAPRESSNTFQEKTGRR